jgi:4-hydroxythreonine-4-phosphate dehydrogenase
MRKLAITTGDPAGIGPEIASKALRYFALQDNIVFIVYGKMITFPDGNRITKITDVKDAKLSNQIYWIEIDSEQIEAGVPSAESGRIAFEILQRCARDLKRGLLEGVVTGPVCKNSIRLNQPDFIGHTEFFAKCSYTSEVIMSFWGPYFNLALLSTHLALRDIPDYLTPYLVEKKLRLIHKEVNRYIRNPRFAMLAINPHAGENCAFGEEDKMVEDILQKLRIEGINIDGPFPSDTFFSYNSDSYDVVISAYHDQGLIPFKMLSSNQGVNVTLGLPFVRTSVDHGTAFDIAGKNSASEKSLLAAIKLAKEMMAGKIEENTNYTHFAHYYDKYMSHVHYEDWAKFILKIYIGIHKRNPQRILELACGTANLSLQFVKKGLKVEASDLSAEMLKIASQKKLAPRLYVHDMTGILPAGRYDLILLFFDSINYLVNPDDIIRMLFNVYNGLQQNGLFIFDISTIKNCQHHFDGYVNLEDDKDIYLIHQSEYDKERQIQETKLTFFTRKKYFYLRDDEIHKQKIYQVVDIIEIIEKTSFHLNGIYALNSEVNLLGVDFATLDANYSRLFFVLQKK